MDKWAIRPDPTPFDPRRHVLLLKGTMTDVAVILRQFGAMCGRPAPATTPEGFNYSLILHGVTEPGLARLGSALNALAPASAAVAVPAAAPVSAPPATPPPMPRLAPVAPVTPPPAEAPPLPSLSPVTPPPVEAPSLAAPSLAPAEPAPLMSLAPAPEAPSLPALGAAPEGPTLGGPALVGPELPTLAAPSLQPPVLEPPSLQAPPPPSLEVPPAVSAPAPEPPAPVLESLAPAPEAPAVPPAPAPAPAIPVLQPPPAQPPAPAPALAAAPPLAEGFVQPPAAPPAAKPFWGLQEALDPGRTFESLLVGAYNRFAHAAATSVVSAPGTMYNPLFLYGAPGSGKTHIAHAVAKNLGQALGDDHVIMTSGSRLARAVTSALAEKRLPELKALFEKSKAMLVDDVHLLAVTDQNRAALAEVFAGFFGRNLQIVLTSIYPPRALGALEEALKISFGKGWSVDLKIPNPNVQVEVMRGFFDRTACPLSNEELKKFHELLGQNYFEALRWMRRLRRLVKLGQALGRQTLPGDVLGPLFDPGVVQPTAELPSAAQLGSVAGFRPPAPSSNGVNVAFLMPKGQEGLAPWVTARFFQTAAEYGISQSYRPVLVDSYDASQPFGVPFAVGELCVRAGAQAAVIVGPPADTNLAQREGEFSHAVGRILDGLEIPMGWIRHRGTTAPSNFLRLHLDLLRSLD